MTTICYRDGILAGDTRAYSGDKQPIGHKIKIAQARQSSGAVVSFGISTPHPGFSEEIRHWVANDRSPDAEPPGGRDFNMLLIDEQGDVYFYASSFVPSGPLWADYYAIGSGAEYALGAMAHGATAREAVEAAAQLDVWTGAPIQFIDTGHAPAEMPDNEDADC